MSYVFNDETISLTALQDRIQTTDLVPSRASLLESIHEKFSIFDLHGLHTLADLRGELKTNKRLEAFAKKTGIESQYLILLRREIEGYVPKAIALGEIIRNDQAALSKFEKAGMRDSAGCYDATCTDEKLKGCQALTGVDPVVLKELAQLVDLTRVQWVSPTTARMLLACGITSPAQLAEMDAQKLYEAFNRVNEKGTFFKGKIGLRDVKRLIHAAGYVD